MNNPPATLPKNISPMPNGMVTMPLPSGITDSAVRKIAKMKNASWKPAIQIEQAPRMPWITAMMNWPLTVPFTMAPILAR